MRDEVELTAIVGKKIVSVEIEDDNTFAVFHLDDGSTMYADDPSYYVDRP